MGAAIFLRQHVFQHGDIGALDSVHRVVDQIADVAHALLAGGNISEVDLRTLGIGLQMLPPRLLRHPEHVGGKIFLRVFRIGVFFEQQFGAVMLECFRDIFEEDQAKRDVLVFRRLKITTELIGHLEQFSLEPKISATVVLRCHMSEITPDSP